MIPILIFGGGENQVSLIKTAKKMGLHAIVIDPNPGAVGKKLADKFKVVPARDYAATKEIALEFAVKGIVTAQMENPMLLMAKLAEELHFPFPSHASVVCARNKFKMKECFKAENIPCAKGFLLNSSDEFILNNTVLDFPLIMKPADAFSSRGVKLINNLSEFNKYREETQNFSSDRTVIVEEYIEGPMYSLEAVICNKKFYFFQATERYKFTDFPFRVELGHIQPAIFKDFEYDMVKNVIERAAFALGLDNCGVHAEFKISADGPKIIEIAARLGGDFNTSHLVPLSTGTSIEKALIETAIGKVPEIQTGEAGFSMIKWIELPAGKKIKKIKEWQEIIDGEKVVNANFYLNEGDMIPKVTHSAQRPGYVIVKGYSRSQVIAYSEKAEMEILSKIRYTDSH